jgi:hypothetical protein
MRTNRQPVGLNIDLRLRRERLMRIEPEWIRTQASFHGIALSDDDIEAIKKILETTKEAIANVHVPPPVWGETPYGFLPPAFGDRDSQ